MDHPKLEYLGSGIDGRMPPESWLDTLDGKRTKLREVDLDKNIQITEVDKTKSAQTSKSKKRSTKAGGHAGLKPHQSLGLEGKLTAMRDTSKYSKHSEFQKTTKIAWMIEETSRDPENITRAREGKPPIHYTKYERELSGFILEHVEVKQEEERRRGTGATDIPPIKDLEGEDDVDKLNKYIHDLQSQPNSKSRQKIWQEIASACWMFLNKKRYTHYVDSIHLGASIHASVTAQHSKTGFLAGAGAKGMEFVDAGAEVGHQRESSSVSKIRVTRGTIESDVVTSEEVIKASLSPVTDLINDKSKELMVVMKSLMRAYTRTHGKL